MRVHGRSAHTLDGPQMGHQLQWIGADPAAMQQAPGDVLTAWESLPAGCPGFRETSQYPSETQSKPVVVARLPSGYSGGTVSKGPGKALKQSNRAKTVDKLLALCTRQATAAHGHRITACCAVQQRRQHRCCTTVSVRLSSVDRLSVTDSPSTWLPAQLPAQPILVSANQVTGCPFGGLCNMKSCQ